MKTFSIHDLERFSGVKAHTLRVWERRYNLLQPLRTTGNIRVYSLEQLKKILNISLLKKNGHRISKLSEAPESWIENKLSLLENEQSTCDKAVDELIINMYAPVPDSFEKALDKILFTVPLEVLIEKILFPFLSVTGLLCMGHKQIEQHLVVVGVRKKLILAIETTFQNKKPESSVLLFLPDSKQLDLGLLYCYYFLKRRGIHVVYLGTEITLENLRVVFQIHQPDYLYTYLQKSHHYPVQKLLHIMQAYAPNSKLINGGFHSEETSELKEFYFQFQFTEALNYMAAISLKSA
ncbi:MAG: MerR family transcriptional regulator [Ferruginibacter sp.]